MMKFACRNTYRHLLTTTALSLCLAAPMSEASAADVSGTEEIVVTGIRIQDLDSVNRTGSRLGLTLRETPAAVDVVTQDTMQIEGLSTVIDAYRSVPGVAAGNIPGSSGQAAMRGFGSSAISYLFDGVRMSDSTVATRNYDTWNYERVEVLKGPASVLYGEGALAGTINLVPRKAALGVTKVEGEAGYGSFNTFHVAGGANLALGPTAAVRSDVSFSRSDGFVTDTDTRKLQITNNLLLQPSDRLSVQLSLDFYQDKNETPYQGLPLIAPGAARQATDIVIAASGYVADKALRDINYNVLGGFANSDSWWARSRVSYKISDEWTLSNELSYYDGDRKWRNSEDYTYNATSGLMDRSTTRIYHQQKAWSERAFVANDGMIGGLHNRFSAGVEYNHTDFDTQRRFGTTTSVNPFAPVRGVFPDDAAANFPGAGNRVDYHSVINSVSAFGEDALNLTPQWLLIGGVRYDHIRLDRTNTDLNANTVTGNYPTFQPFSWRVGTVYDVTEKTQLYAQYSRAVTPVGSLLLASLANSRFNLTTGWSAETGVKSSLMEDRLVIGASAYYIRQNDILTRDPATPSLTVQGGAQSSRGVEVSASVALTQNLHVDGNFAILRAKFDRLFAAGGLNLAGNRPTNVPERLGNLGGYYTFSDVPLTIGASVRATGDFYTSTTNTVKVKGAAVADAQISYRLPFAEVTLRGRNLFDKFYANWSGYSATQVYLGAPRSVEITLRSSF